MSPTTPRILAFIAALVCVVAFLASPQTSAAANPSIALTQCANGGDGSNFTCATISSTGWINANINGAKGQYFLGDFYPNRMIFNNLTAGNRYCFAFGFDYSKGSLPAVDYVGTYNYTIPADPTLNTTFTLGVDVPDTIAIPQDPMVAGGGTIGGSPYSGFYIPGELTLWGGTFVPGSLVYSNPATGALDAAAPGFQQSLDYCFNATSAQAVLAWGAHIAIPAEWGALSRPTGSPYHVSSGSFATWFNGRTGVNDMAEFDSAGTFLTTYNIGRTDQQIQDTAVSEPSPQAISLGGISTSGGNTPPIAILALLTLALTAITSFAFARRES